MTFQERWAEGPPVGEPPKADLLTPWEVRDALAIRDNYNDYLETQYAIDGVWVKRLCRNYLTLWERNKELEERYEGFLQRVARDLSEIAQEIREL